MSLAIFLFYAVCLAELPGPAITLDFDGKPMPAGVKVDGRTSVEPGKHGQALRCHRAPATPDPTRLVAKIKGRHCGFPSLIRLQNGELLGHFRAGPGHIGRGVIMQIRSKDEGKTWSEPRTIFEDPVWDSRSHSTAIQLKSGTILLGFYRHDRKRGFTGARVLRSTDGGKTYAASDLPNPYTKTFVYNIGRPIQLPDGTVLMPLHGDLPDGRRRAAGIIRSSDDGKTWGDFSIIAVGGRTYYETNILMLPNGEMLAMNRSEPGPWMWQCRSKDNGHTWTLPENSRMQGDVGELLLLKSGAIVCAYRSQEPGTRDTRASISRDNGHTWGHEIVVDPNGGDHGYTSSIQFPDGRILTLNYCGKDGATQIRSRLYTEAAFHTPNVPDVPGHVLIPYAKSLPLRDALTLAAWVQPKTAHKWQRLFWKDGILSLYLNEGRLDGWVMAGGAQDAVSEATIPIGEWTHVAMAYSAADPKHQVRLYINGREVAYRLVENTGGDHRIKAAARPLFISSPQPIYAFDGLLDAVRIHPTALTPEQINQLCAQPPR